MTKKIYYEKVGRRYVPVAEYDNDLIDSYPEGSHLVVCRPGRYSRRYNIIPAHAAMIAAGMYAEDAICDALNDANKMRPSKEPITPEQLKAWKNVQKAFNADIWIQRNSLREVAEAGVKAMIAESEKLLSNTAVKNAYEQFMLVCELTKEENNG